MSDSVHIAIPTIDNKPHVQTMLGVLSVWSRVPCSISFHTGSFLPRLRDDVIHDFLTKHDASYLLCVDADIVWRWTDLAALLKLDVDFAFGRYRQKKPAGPWNATMNDSGDFVACGFGFVLLKREPLRVFAEKHPVYLNAKGEPRHCLFGTTSYVARPDGTLVAEGEDYAFCRRWVAAGGTIHTSMEVELGHVGEKLW